MYQTAEGRTRFRQGRPALFRENNRDLGVKNGMLGTVEKADPGRLEIRLDSARGLGRMVSVSMADYAAVDHGYATTIHKAQGATVDRSFVLASGSYGPAFDLCGHDPSPRWRPTLWVAGGVCRPQRRPPDRASAGAL